MLLSAVTRNACDGGSRRETVQGRLKLCPAIQTRCEVYMGRPTPGLPIFPKSNLLNNLSRPATNASAPTSSHKAAADRSGALVLASNLQLIHFIALVAGWSGLRFV